MIYRFHQAKNTLRVHETMEDGRYVHLYFCRCKHSNKIRIWTVGLYIGGTIKQANEWYDSRKTLPLRITGDGSVIGLRHALNIVGDFIERMGENEELQITGEDAKRFSAYRFLLRYAGWTQDVDCLLYRNPDVWEWNPNKATAL